MSEPVVLPESSLDDGEYEDFEGLPIGFKFMPQDHELVTVYLMDKIMGYEVPYNVIKDVDFYCLDPPQFSDYDFRYGKDKNEAYYFIETDNSEADRRRISRNGYWEASESAEEIEYENRIVGFKTRFEFYGIKQVIEVYDGSPNWVMHEFRIHPTNFPVDQSLDNKIKTKMKFCVICRIAKL